MKQLVRTVAVVAVAGGCALKGDVRRVEQQLAEFREETARADTARAVTLQRIATSLDRINDDIIDSLRVQQNALLSLRGDVRSELTEVQRQLVAILELAGMSQTRLAELRRELDGRASPAPSGVSDGQAEAYSGSEPSADELWSLGRQQQAQGSPQSARIAFQKLVRDYPQHERASDALYQIGETFGSDQPDSASTAWEGVVSAYADSRVAPRALYSLGLMYERLGDERAARLQYQRVVNGYPRSDEADLARSKLGNS